MNGETSDLRDERFTLDSSAITSENQSFLEDAISSEEEFEASSSAFQTLDVNDVSPTNDAGSSSKTEVVEEISSTSEKRTKEKSQATSNGKDW
ncbi:hypothetical protein JTE90_018254 [Oedothorax gibbosus]|uniref:Uncharacterized protein n=1 Tax=Oedothorax gibbosus TaxID=931172 RepID=A0AAV6U9G0_9ARAC|nr:hypothetical protein JTE90_018254 [Oedothorax gibbosus]